MEEKGKVVEELQVEMQGVRKGCAMEVQNRDGKIRRLYALVKKMQRMYGTEIDNISRSLKDIKIYI